MADTEITPARKAAFMAILNANISAPILNIERPGNILINMQRLGGPPINVQEQEVGGKTFHLFIIPLGGGFEGVIGGIARAMDDGTFETTAAVAREDTEIVRWFKSVLDHYYHEAHPETAPKPRRDATKVGRMFS